MSKGHGRIERAILQALHRGGPFWLGATTQHLVDYVRSGEALWTVADADRPRAPPTRAELESVRRALRNLKRKGLVLAGYKTHGFSYFERPGKKARTG